ncbi:MAG: PAS domain-containing protein [Candidatus Hydrogenedentota bacterium]
MATPNPQLPGLPPDEERDRRLRDAALHAGIALWDWELASDKLTCNAMLPELLGEEEPRALAHFADLLARVHPEDRQRVESLLDAHRNGERAEAACECRLQHPGHGWLWTKLRARITERNAEGAPLRMAGTLADVSDKVEETQGFAALNDFLQMVMENMPIGIAVHTIEEGAFLFMNSRFRACYGLPEQGVRTVEAFFEAAYPAPDQRAHVREQVMADLASGAPGRMRWTEVAIEHPGRETRYISAFNIPVPERNLMIATVWDITERIRSEEALRKSQSYLTIATAIAHVGYWEYNAVEKTLTCTAEIYRIYGFEPDSVTPTLEMHRRLVQPHDRRRIEQAVEAAMAEARRFDLDYTVVRADDTEVVCHVIADPMYNDAGTVVGLRGVLQDVTAAHRTAQETRRLESQVQQARKFESLGALAGGVAHDFNNLLVSILGNADLAFEDLSPVAPARSSLEEIVRAARRAADLTRQMLAYAGQRPLVNAELDVRELICEASHLLEQAAGEHAHLKYKFGPGLLRVHGDANQLRQVLTQIVANAGESLGAPGGVVTVRTGVRHCTEEDLRMPPLLDTLPPGKYVTIEITDTGCGMEPATVERVFDPFFSTKFTGRGLGLAAALGTVRAHRGALQVMSDPGLGSTFRVYLPALAATTSASATAHPAAGQKRTVLLVDEDDSVRTLGRRMLERRGYMVSAAKTLQEASRLLRQGAEPASLVILDMTLAQEAGKAACEALRRAAEGLPFVLCCDMPKAPATPHTELFAPAAFVQKPYESANLLQAVQNALAAET